MHIIEKSSPAKYYEFFLNNEQESLSCHYCRFPLKSLDPCTSEPFKVVAHHVWKNSNGYIQDGSKHPEHSVCAKESLNFKISNGITPSCSFCFAPIDLRSLFFWKERLIQEVKFVKNDMLLGLGLFTMQIMTISMITGITLIAGKIFESLFMDEGSRIVGALTGVVSLIGIASFIDRCISVERLLPQHLVRKSVAIGAIAGVLVGNIAIPFKDDHGCQLVAWNGIYACIGSAVGGVFMRRRWLNP